MAVLRSVALAIAVAGVVAGAVGCGSASYGVAPPPDGNGGDAGTLGDGSIETNLLRAACQIANHVCDNETVRDCDGGAPGVVSQICGDTCSLGRCTSMACRTAEESDGTRGCRFYGVQVDNIDSDDSKNLMLILSNSGTSDANVSVSFRTAAGVWVPTRTAVVPKNGGARLELNAPVAQAGVTDAGAFRVDSDAPVTAVEIVSDDLDLASESSGGTMLRPIQVLGLSHMALVLPQQTSPEVERLLPGSRSGASALTIVATADNTHVTLDLTAPAMIDASGTVMGPTDGSIPIVLPYEGDVLQIFSAAEGADLTGTTIAADKKIAVYAGNIFTTYGYTLMGYDGGDLLIEALPPTGLWSMEYAGVRLSPNVGCGAFFEGQGTAVWKAVAAFDSTDITLTMAHGATIDIGGGPQAMVTLHLDHGQSQSFEVRTDASASAFADFMAQSALEKPFLLAQTLDCEPALSWAIDATHGLKDDLAITLPPAFQHEIVVVRAKGMPVSLDGVALPSSQFTAVSDGGEFEVARLSDAMLGSCRDLLDPCQHRLGGVLAGVAWRGMDVVCSYALTVPPSHVCGLKTGDCLY